MPLTVEVIMIVALLVGCAPSSQSDFLAFAKENNAGLLPSLTDVRLGLAPDDLGGTTAVVPVDDSVVGAIRPGVEDYTLPGEDSPSRDPQRGTDLSAMLELDDPELLEKHRNDATYTYFARPYGTLIDDNAEEDLEFTDVEQGSIANCYMAAAFSSLLYADDDRLLRNGLIREVKNEMGQVVAYAVRVHHAWNGQQDVLVDAAIPRKSSDKVLYARSTDTEYNDEEWAISLIEKAFAQWRGGYEAIGNGGYAGDVFQGLSGATATSRTLSWMTDDTLVRTIQDAKDNQQPMTAGTYGKGSGPFGKDGGADPEGTQIYAWHAYTIMDADWGTDGAYIKLRNPWAAVEPPETYGADPAFDGEKAEDDGIFWINVEQFRRLYQSMVVGGGYRPDTTPPADVDDLVVVSDGDQLFLTFTATGDDEHEGLAYRYDVRVSSDPIDGNNFETATPVIVADPASPGTQEKLVLTGVDPVQTPFVAIAVVDEIDQKSWPATAPLPQGPTPEPETILFDFETNQDGFRRDSSANLWHRTQDQAANGQWSFRFGVDGESHYNTNQAETGKITSSTIDLTDAATASLSWQQILDVESDAGYDVAMVDIEVGDVWTLLWQKGEVGPDWTTQAVDLNAYAGEEIRLRFVFDTIDEINNGTLGWFVDDIRVVTVAS